MESEGSWRQNSDPRNTNIIRHKVWDEFAKQNEVQLTTQTYRYPEYYKGLHGNEYKITDVIE
jgi:hypothetical protein